MRTTLGDQAQDPRLSKGGIAVFDDKLSAAHSLVAQIHETVRKLDDRLYNASPQTANKVPGTGEQPSTIEGSLEMLVSRLHELDALANKVLHG